MRVWHPNPLVRAEPARFTQTPPPTPVLMRVWHPNPLVRAEPARFTQTPPPTPPPTCLDEGLAPKPSRPGSRARTIHPNSSPHTCLDEGLAPKPSRPGRARTIHPNSSPHACLDEGLAPKPSRPGRARTIHPNSSPHTCLDEGLAPKPSPHSFRLAPTACSVVGVVAWLAVSASAQEDRATLELRPPPSLALGDRAELTVVVHVPPNTREPLLLTPTSVGDAVMVVRGRLLRSDAVDPEADPLTFRVPLVAAAPGTAVIRAKVQSFECQERCRSVELEREVVVRVERQREREEG